MSRHNAGKSIRARCIWGFYGLGHGPYLAGGVDDDIVGGGVVVVVGGCRRIK